MHNNLRQPVPRIQRIKRAGLPILSISTHISEKKASGALRVWLVVRGRTKSRTPILRLTDSTSSDVILRRRKLDLHIW